MQVTIREPKSHRASGGSDGRLVLGAQTDTPYLQVVLNGQVIGLSFKLSNKIHWTVPKKLLPPAVIWKAIGLLQRRNREMLAECQETGT